jgi:hypothetical protein
MDKELAEFALLGLRVGLLTPDQVRSWADGIIANSPEPPAWALDLSTADLPEMISLLNAVAGERSGERPLHLVGSLLRRQWRHGELPLRRVEEIGWQLHLEDRLPSPEVGGDWGVVLYCEYEEFEQGYRTEAEMRASVEEKLGRYAEYEGELPVWA